MVDCFLSFFPFSWDSDQFWMPFNQVIVCHCQPARLRKTLSAPCDFSFPHKATTPQEVHSQATSSSLATLILWNVPSGDCVTLGYWIFFFFFTTLTKLPPCFSWIFMRPRRCHSAKGPRWQVLLNWSSLTISQFNASDTDWRTTRGTRRKTLTTFKEESLTNAMHVCMYSGTFFKAIPTLAFSS